MPDVDQQAALDALRKQGERCLGLLAAIAAGNDRILARIAAGDPVGHRIATGRYNRACRDRAADLGSNDPGAVALRDDADLKAVCDNRWLLGEAVEVLGARHQRLDTIAEPYDDFERCIRQSVTGVDPSPDELALALEAARQEGARAATWRPRPREDEPTLADSWIRRVKNHPLGAAIFIAALVLAAVAGILGNLSRGWFGPGPSRTPAATAGTPAP